jgi:pyroglutamyl-peptidase
MSAMSPMRAGRPVVLLTGFGPFPGMPENASTRLASELATAARSTFPSHAFVAAHLPTEWHQGPRRVRDLYAAHEPAAAIHFGVSGRASGFEIEMRGHNRRAAIADAAGVVPQVRHLDPDGPPVLPSRLPIDRILMALRAHGLPVSLSRDAGGYLCNAVLYHASDLSRRHRDLRAGFIHVPASLSPIRRLSKRPPIKSRLAWDEAVLGGLLIIAATLGLPP